MRTCFDALKETRYRAKATRIARGTYGLYILKKSFARMKAFNLKQKLL